MPIDPHNEETVIPAWCAELMAEASLALDASNVAAVKPLPRANETKLGWKIDPEFLISLSSKVVSEGWGAPCLEQIELVALGCEETILSAITLKSEADIRADERAKVIAEFISSSQVMGLVYGAAMGGFHTPASRAIADEK